MLMALPPVTLNPANNTEVLPSTAPPPPGQKAFTEFYGGIVMGATSWANPLRLWPDMALQIGRTPGLAVIGTALGVAAPLLIIGYLFTRKK